MDQIEQIKSDLILKRLNSPEELQAWMYTYIDIKFPLGTVYPGSTHSPVEAMWRIYELFLTGQSKEVPQVAMLSSRDSYKTLCASAIMVLLMVHFRIQLATAGAIKAQSDKMIQYIAGHFRKITPYLEANGWQKLSESKSRTDWLDENGGLCFIRVVVATVAGMNCVKGNTKIATDRGNLTASQIYSILGEGENIKALSYNHEDNVEEYKQIVNAEKNTRKKVLKIKTTEGTIECSPEHKIYVKGKGYIKAKKLVVGDKCLKKNRKKKTSYHEVEAFFKKNNYKLLTPQKEYCNESKKVNVKCPNGHDWSVTFQKFKNKNVRCGKCREVDYETVKKTFEKNSYKIVTTKKEYKNTKTKIKTICPNNHLYEVSYNRFSVGHRCKKGDCNNKKHSTKFVLDFLKKEGYQTDLKLYKNQKQLIKVKCPNGHDSKINFSNFYNHGKRCKHCYRPFSKGHEEILNYIKAIYKEEVRVNDRKKIYPFELDIYIPKINFGIEFDGLYWHSEKVKKNAKKINKQKAEKIKEKDINIMCIYEDEWNDAVKKNIIKNMIASRLGIISKKIRASKLKLKKLNKNKEFSKFFEENHLDGHAQSSFAYGLFNENEELISCMSFRKSFSDKKWEIARFATKSNIRVYGNASKFVKAFKKEYGSNLVTYSNNRLSLGKTYSKIGFKEITKTKEPSYYYTDFKNRIWRFKCKRINKPEVLKKYPTEKAQAEGGVFSEKFLGHSKPLYKIYDYGHRKWELKC